MDHPSSPSWRAWLDARAPRYLLFARSQTRCEADAHDLFQDTLVELWRRSHHQPPADAFVFTTLRRRAVDLARHADRRPRREPQAHAAPDSVATLRRTRRTAK